MTVLSSCSIPNEPVATNSSASCNVHRLVRRSPTVLVLQPGRTPWVVALAFLAASPVVLAICIGMRAGLVLTVLLSVIPLCGVIPMVVVALCYQFLGTRARFDRDKQRISITGVRHGLGRDFSLSDIVAIQFCGAGIRP
jgi:hypothetical protein